jgi:hypothetical protein
VANLITLADAFVAVLPAAAIFFGAYGRFDGMFRDNVVFLYFIGGLIVGGLLGVVSLFALALEAPIPTVIILSLFYPITVTLGINRRKWQGDRHAIFNGGALGLGIAVMLGFTLLYRMHDALHALQDTNGLGAALSAYVSLPILSEAVLLSIALAGIFFGLGLLAGDSVRRRRPLPVAFLAAGIVLPIAVFLEELVRSRALLWAMLLAAYGAIFGILAERKLFAEGLSEDARKLRRRRRRAQE